jgi:hypothetical protein
MIHLITYGNHKFEKSKKRLHKEAIDTGWFDTVTVYGPEDLDNDFKERFELILKQSRGGGYWIWKSHIIKKKLGEIKENDILIYLDAGCSINPEGKNRFEEYIELLNRSGEGIISFQLPHLEKIWTTKEIFNYFNVNINSEISNSGQILSGIRIMKKTKNLINLINIESKTLHNNPLLFTDYYNKNQENYFKDNRHEQSIFSIIRKMNNPILLNDETYFEPFGNKESLKYPFWAKRLRG